MNIPPFLAAPIADGLCSYGDLYKLTIDDFANMNEIMLVKNENAERARKAQEAKARE